MRLRRLVCPVLGCARQTFREQVPGAVERYQRRTSRLASQFGAVVRELAGRAGTRVLSALNMAASQNTALRVLRGAALLERPVPRVLGIDDFSLRKGRVYATVLIDATPGKRVDVIEGRGAETVADWLRAHPGVEVVCRDGSTVYAQAVARRFPARSRSPTGDTCGTVWQTRAARRSPRTVRAGRERQGCGRAGWPKPRVNAGSRSTTCARPVWDSGTAPAAWAWR